MTMTPGDLNHTPLPTPPLPPPQYNFKSVYGLLEIWRDGEAQTLSSQHLNPCSFDPKSTKYNVSSSLGDFSRLFQHLDWPVESAVTRTPESTDAELSMQDTPPSSLSDTVRRIKGKEVRWRDEINTEEALHLITPRDLLNIPRKPRHRSPTKQKEVKNSADFESEAEDYLRPAIVTAPQLWHPPALPVLRIDPQIIQPLDTLTRQEKMDKLAKKLDRFKKPKNSNEGIHVFVDVSNIVIGVYFPNFPRNYNLSNDATRILIACPGFYDALKIKRGLNVKAYTKQAPISWQSLALILERGRAVARRVVVGSNSQPIRGQAPKLPSYMLEAEECGYELNILERVLKRKDTTPARKRKSNGNGYATTSGHSSSDGGNLALKVWRSSREEISAQVVLAVLLTQLEIRFQNKELMRFCR